MVSTRTDLSSLEQNLLQVLTQNRQSNCSRKLPKSLENYRNSIFLSLLSLSRFELNFKCSECVQMRGGRGLFIGNNNQSGTSRVAPRVSLRMAPYACTATPRAPHGWLHVSVSYSMTPRPLPVWIHGLAPCKETPRPPHVWPHGPVACIATPRASMCHSACCDNFYCNTSCFSCHTHCQELSTTS